MDLSRIRVKCSGYTSCKLSLMSDIGPRAEANPPGSGTKELSNTQVAGRAGDRPYYKIIDLGVAVATVKVPSSPCVNLGSP